jgi:uncharacterized protein
MFRILIIIAALLLVYLIVKNRLTRRGPGKKSPVSTVTDEMVKCLQCKTYIPRKEAIISGTEIFCCKQHQRDWESDHKH